MPLKRYVRLAPTVFGSALQLSSCRGSATNHAYETHARTHTHHTYVAVAPPHSAADLAVA
jgi:hypothetical protein